MADELNGEIPPHLAATPIDPGAADDGGGFVATPRRKPLKSNRLTMRIVVHHTHLTQDPTAAESTGNIELASKRRPEEYWLTDDDILMPGVVTAINPGRIPAAEMGLVLVENLIGKARRVNPTEEEAAADARQIIHILIGSPDNPYAMEVPPGLFQSVRAVAGVPIYLLAVGDQSIPARITVFPR